MADEDRGDDAIRLVVSFPKKMNWQTRTEVTTRSAWWCPSPRR